MIAIEKLSRAEKLRMMEALWRDLSTDSAGLASPQWHGQALQAAQDAVASGQAQWVDWAGAKDELRRRARS